jgi:hypothetical protein
VKARHATVARGLLATALFTGTAAAQVRLGVKLDHAAYLQFEPVRAVVSIRNDSVETLTTDPAASGRDLTLTLFVEHAGGEPARPRRSGPFGGTMTVPPDEQRSFMVDIGEWRDVVRTGRYTVLVEARLGERAYESERGAFTIVRGLEIKNLDKQVPGYADRLRRYSLRYWQRGNREHIFLRVDEPDRNLNFGLFDMGRVVRVTDPKIEVHADGTVIVVHQSGRDCFTRSTLKSEADRVRFLNQTYHLENGDPYPNIEKRTR